MGRGRGVVDWGLVTLSDGENGRCAADRYGGGDPYDCGAGGGRRQGRESGGPSVTYDGSGAVTATLASSAASGDGDVF